MVSFRLWEAFREFCKKVTTIITQCPASAQAGAKSIRIQQPVVLGYTTGCTRSWDCGEQCTHCPGQRGENPLWNTVPREGLSHYLSLPHQKAVALISPTTHKATTAGICLFSPSHWHQMQGDCQYWDTKAFVLAPPESTAVTGCSKIILQAREKEKETFANILVSCLPQGILFFQLIPEAL